MEKRTSYVGHYTGYAHETATGARKSSLYVESGDGTRLAVDLILPDPLPEDPIPAILIASRGGRFDPEKGNGDSLVAPLIQYGYAVVVGELRGCGASYGTNDSFGSYEHVQDTTAMIQWICRQPWSNGKVGMAGISNRSYIQLCTAAYGPEGLAAITPTVAITDFYYQNYPGGVSAVPSSRMSQLPCDFGTEKVSRKELLQSVRPVDADPEGIQAYEAYETGHFGKNRMFTDSLLHPNMNRDTPNPDLGGQKTNLTLPPLFRFQEGHAQNIRQHQFIGQLESGALGQLAHYKAQGGSFVLGPWTHGQSRSGNPNVEEGMLDFTAEYHRYFDAVLKGMDNGFDQAPPVCYYVFHAKKGEHWRYADSWPLATERRMRLYLDGAVSGTCASQNDGSLSQKEPKAEAWDAYQVRTDLSVFDNGDGKGATYNRMTMCWEGDMTEGVDQKGLTYTSAPLFANYDNQMAGCVSVDLWVTCNQRDCDFVVYLEEVMEDGTSRYMKDGLLRASHRTSAPNAAWESMGATWHTSMTADVKRCLEEGMETPVHLQFAIEPIVWCFRKNSRIRLTVTCANPAACQHPYDPDCLPEIRLYRGGGYVSSISIPFVEHEENVYNGWVTTETDQGPGTLYFFPDHVYLYYQGGWRKWDSGSPEADYQVEGMEAVFEQAGFRFRLEGAPIRDGIIQEYQGGGATGQPLPAVRHAYLDTVPVTPSEQFLFAPDQKTLRMDVFRSRTWKEPVPAVLYIHGYGGSYSVFNEQLRRLYGHGYGIVGIDLRNYPSNLFPDYIQDVKGAIRYVRTHAPSWGIDPNRLGCYGVSLGGNAALMAAVSGEVPDLEGTVGGNLHASSRLQAVAAGYAWSDLLQMGADIREEYQGEPALLAQKLARTDGEQAPCAQVIGFAGPGKGIGRLRLYQEEQKEGTDPLLDQKLRQAQWASPVSYIGPDSPPAVLFGGYGMKSVDIALNQSLRSFRKFQENGVTCFLFANTQGEYGRKEEILCAILHFFDHYLRDRGAEPKLVIRTDGGSMVANTLPAPEEDRILREGETLLVEAAYLQEVLGVKLPAEEIRNGRGYVMVPGRLAQKGIVVQAFPDKGMITLTLDYSAPATQTQTP